MGVDLGKKVGILDCFLPDAGIVPFEQRRADLVFLSSGFLKLHEESFAEAYRCIMNEAVSHDALQVVCYSGLRLGGHIF